MVFLVLSDAKIIPDSEKKLKFSLFSHFFQKKVRQRCFCKKNAPQACLSSILWSIKREKSVILRYNVPKFTEKRCLPPTKEYSTAVL